MKNSRPDWFTLGATASAASLVTMVIENFVAGGKKIRKRIPRKHSIAAPLAGLRC